MGRYIRYWYTYRLVVALLLGLALTLVTYGLYTQQVACDTHIGTCAVKVSVHPEDRFMGYGKPDPGIVIVGIDNASVAAIGSYPIPRDRYAQVLQNLEKDGALVVAFDVGFTDPHDNKDTVFASALKASTIPVVLSYEGSGTYVADGKLVQCSSKTAGCPGIDQIPLKQFWCSDANSAETPRVACQQPDKNVILASTDVQLDADGVVRRIPLFVQPACFSGGTCNLPVINTFGLATFGAAALGTDFKNGVSVKESDGTATFTTAWTAPVDNTGSTQINFSGPPGNYAGKDNYIDFASVWNGTADAAAIKGKIVLVGYYGLSGVNDQQLVTTSAGSNDTLPMQGIELHANVIQMFDHAQPVAGTPSALLTPEPPWLVFTLILVLSLLTALAVARVSVLWGLLVTAAALVVATLALATLQWTTNIVPDVFHPLLAIALVYTGVTAYRFLYEDREKRKVTNLFGHYLKPEIVAQLAKTRGGVDDILRGGERRDITLLFVDVRGFTSMSERMEADEVVSVVQMYLDHLSGIIFTWDGTVDKYVGDEIVAFWNAPRRQENHALLAVRCAYDLINRAPELQQRLLEKGLPPIRWGIGINTGPAVVGNMGSRSRLQYTALGDTVNTAARFCANAPAYHLLIGQPTYDQCKDYIAVDMVPGVQLKGKSAETFRIYQVTAIRETPTSPWVPFPTEMALLAQDTYTQQYTHKTILGNVNSTSRDILVGEAAQQALDQAAVAPTPPYGTPAYGTPVQGPEETPTTAGL
ncbi:MAG TPA: adenylate/guanylate cyclase domain-containing protein [Candidatus Dormibacteraeota bacterium]|nr:adenylate/guanylate cyclase domain-containing protein [Candidatus Dormibacteraeota bacterium]